jgi:hypothetical protein
MKVKAYFTWKGKNEVKTVLAVGLAAVFPNSAPQNRSEKRFHFQCDTPGKEKCNL